MPSIVRTVYYYKVFNPDGSIPFYKKLQKICQLPELEREYTHQDVTVNIQITTGEHDGEMVLSGVVRLLRYLAPSVGLRGTNMSKPIQLEIDEGVNEKTHFVYAPSKNVIAVEYNHYGPKVGLLFKIVNELYRANFDTESKKNSYIYITNGNGLRRISDSKAVKKIHLEYVNQTLDSGNHTPLAQAYMNALSIGNTQAAEIILKPEPHSRNPIMTGAEFVKSIISNRTNSSTDINEFEKLKVTFENETGTTEVIDLIKDKLSKDFNAIPLQDGTKEINSDYLLSAMYDDIADREFRI